MLYETLKLQMVTNEQTYGKFHQRIVKFIQLYFPKN